MVNGNKVIVVLPAYNAEFTLEKTVQEIPGDVVDTIILVDDKSDDKTIEIATKLEIDYIVKHHKNKGYGGNQKSCYDKALELNADIIVMLHPDYQYTPKLIHSMVYLISNNIFDVVLGSRILGKGAIKGGMPVYKYIANRALTFIQNILINQKLSEYHTGYRAFNSKVFEDINYQSNSDDFVFDNQFLSQILFKDFRVGEITCPSNYFSHSSSINFLNSIKYGLGVLKTSVEYFISKLFPKNVGAFKNLK